MPLKSNEPPLADRLAALDESFQLFITTAKTYPVELRRSKPNEIAFSATEIVYHMLDVERLWQRRIRGLLDGSVARFQQMDPDKEARDEHYNARDFDAGITELRATRAETHELLAGMSAEQLELTGIHSRYGEMNTWRILEIMEGHDRQHASQISRTLRELSGRVEGQG